MSLLVSMHVYLCFGCLLFVFMHALKHMTTGNEGTHTHAAHSSTLNRMSNNNRQHIQAKERDTIVNTKISLLFV